MWFRKRSYAALTNHEGNQQRCQYIFRWLYSLWRASPKGQLSQSFTRATMKPSGIRPALREVRCQWRGGWGSKGWQKLCAKWAAPSPPPNSLTPFHSWKILPKNLNRTPEFSSFLIPPRQSPVIKALQVRSNVWFTVSVFLRAHSSTRSLVWSQHYYNLPTRSGNGSKKCTRWFVGWFCLFIFCCFCLGNAA